ncbi:hypothetical protein D9Q98_007638 [Chlorella vulgaris]|uniref:Uncharacterized protein n=1 Tax=Chlorella vulgaris TaxID=3077 RepID=A0A9D4TLI4_CHLVU|nr:hypothetical protein D9Q98_007638 [Chlorella vulgaris]
MTATRLRIVLACVVGGWGQGVWGQSGANPLLALVKGLGGGGALSAGLPMGDLSSVAETLGSIAGNVQGMFCTDPNVTLGHKVPSTLFGPQLNITVSAGNCSLVKEGLTGKNITCFGPSISFSKAPISFVPKHHTPDVFVAGSCVFGKNVGPQKEAEVETLYSGDDDEVVFGSLDHFLQALKAGGGLAGIWGDSNPPAAGTNPAAARFAAALLAQQEAAAAGSAGSDVAAGSLEDLLQRAGWQVVMNSGAEATKPEQAAVQM